MLNNFRFECMNGWGKYLTSHSHETECETKEAKNKATNKNV